MRAPAARGGRTRLRQPRRWRRPVRHVLHLQHLLSRARPLLLAVVTEGIPDQTQAHVRLVIQGRTNLPSAVRPAAPVRLHLNPMQVTVYVFRARRWRPSRIRGIVQVAYRQPPRVLVRSQTDRRITLIILTAHG